MFDSLIAKYHDIQARREDGEGGFTLIELLVVVVIIGILVAIAIPLYLNYQNDAKDKSAKSDLQNAKTAVQACYSANNTWPVTNATPGTSGGKAALCANYSLNASDGNKVSYTAPATGDDFTIVVKGGNHTYTYSSSSGNTVESS